MYEFCPYCGHFVYPAISQNPHRGLVLTFTRGFRNQMTSRICNQTFYTQLFPKKYFRPRTKLLLYFKLNSYVKILTFLSVDQSWHMTAHSFQLRYTNNFYSKHFSLKAIFTPLEGFITPKWGKLTYSFGVINPFRWVNIGFREKCFR